ncbi:unnamed protein product, partial [Brassica rapa subsp. trilocularis]
RILFNGLNPITKETFVDFDSGEEALISLEYEALENHCTYCLRLTHLASECSFRPPTQQVNISWSLPPAPRSSPPTQRPAHTVGPKVAPYAAPSQSHQSGPRNNETYSKRLDRHGNPFGERVSASLITAKPLRNRISASTEEMGTRTIDPSGVKDLMPSSPPYTTSRAPRKQYRETNSSFYEPARRSSQLRNNNRSSHYHPRENEAPHSAWVEKIPRPPVERNLNVSDFPPIPRIPSTDEVMEELREVSYQYANCPDPTESAARKQRILDGEVHGLMEKTAVGIIAAAEASANSAQQLQSFQPSSTAGPIYGHPAAVEQTITLPTLPPAAPQTTSGAISKRRGRPPKAKTATLAPKRTGPTTKRNTPSQRLLTGSSSRKRLLSQVQRSP